MKKSDPPRHLTPEGRALWRRLTAAYPLDDPAGIAVLQVAIEAHDRAMEARKILKAEGTIVKDRFGAAKCHPAVLVERDSRGQFLAALKALQFSPPETK